MYQVTIHQPNKPVDIVQHGLCTNEISDVENMLTGIVTKRLGVPGIVLMPIDNHNFLAFQLVNLFTEVSVEEIEGVDK